ncbi:MAG: hypothetical protein ACREXR_07625 [Gammaproteobacteria bacterium]
MDRVEVVHLAMARGGIRLAIPYHPAGLYADGKRPSSSSPLLSHAGLQGGGTLSHHSGPAIFY